MTATTTQLEQTTVLLESLHASYGAILEQAKIQLESIEVPESTVDRITNDLTNNSNFLSRLRRTTVEELTTEIQRNTITGSVGDRLIAHLATQVGNKLGEALQVQLDTKLKEYLESGVVEAAIEAKIGAHTELASAVETKATLRQAFVLAFDLDKEDEAWGAAQTDDQPF